MIDAELCLRRGSAAEDAGDYALARACYERAAELDYPIGLTSLAYLYDVGLGVAVDKARAMQLYRSAWRRHRDACAANNIAILYRERGERRTMFRWLQRCADAGDNSAHLQLAKCYANGVGVRRSVELAVRSLAIVLHVDANVSEDDEEEAEAMMAALRPRLVVPPA